MVLLSWRASTMESTTAPMSSPNVVVGRPAGAVAIPANSPTTACTWLIAVTSRLTHSAPNTAPAESRSGIVEDLTSFPSCVRVR